MSHSSSDHLDSSDAAPAGRSRLVTPKRLALGGATIALLVGGGFALSGASFTDEQTVGGNTVGTASLTIGETASSPVDVGDLLPGQTAPAAEVIAFENTGTVPFSYTVTLEDVDTDNADPSEFLDWIEVTVTSGGESVSGTLDDLPAIDDVVLANGADATVEVTVGLSADATNAAQDSSANFDVTVTASQIDTP